MRNLRPAVLVAPARGHHRRDGDRVARTRGDHRPRREAVGRVGDDRAALDLDHVPAAGGDERAAVLADKARGVSPEAAEEPAQATDVIDLTDALRRSVEQARDKRGGKAKGDDLGELNKGELDKRAKELGVRGRSKMNRSDLEAAVRDAASGSRAAS